MNNKRVNNNHTGVYIIRKYVAANSASEAILKEKKIAVHDVWLDEDCKTIVTGFNINNK